MRHLNRDEIYAFLGEGSRTGKLATVRADGRPHNAPIWFVVDGDDLVFMTMETSVKARNMRRDPRVALTVDDQVFPYTHIIVEGTVTMTHDVDKLEWSMGIARRYVPEDMIEFTGQRNADPHEYVVRLTPTKLIGRAAVASK
jgi:PPOX class probable F420-dependent enzyme